MMEFIICLPQNHRKRKAYTDVHASYLTSSFEDFVVWFARMMVLYARWRLKREDRRNHKERRPGEGQTAILDFLATL